MKHLPGARVDHVRVPKARQLKVEGGTGFAWPGTLCIELRPRITGKEALAGSRPSVASRGAAYRHRDTTFYRSRDFCYQWGSLTTFTLVAEPGASLQAEKPVPGTSSEDERRRAAAGAIHGHHHEPGAMDCDPTLRTWDHRRLGVFEEVAVFGRCLAEGAPSTAGPPGGLAV